MISGRRGTYAVLAPVLMAVTMLLATPAWTKDAQDKNDSERTGETTNQGGSSRSVSKASGNNSAGSKETTGGNTSRSKSKASEQDPLAGSRVEVQDKNNDKKVNKGDILTVFGDYEVSSDASLTAKDRDKDQATFDKRNAKITATDDGDLKVEVTKDPDVKGGNGELSTTGLTVTSKGVRHGKNRASHHHGRRGGGGARQYCTQELTQGRFAQYSPIDQNQYCILIQERKRGHGGGGNANNDVNNEDDTDNDTETGTSSVNDDNIQTSTAPEGQVVDTSSLEELPFTGGPSPSGVALIAGLALFGVGAGVSAWRLGSGRVRSSDD